jgi:hypothetical protein
MEAHPTQPGGVEEKCRLRLRGSIGVPIVVVKTRLCSFQSLPQVRRSALWLNLR